MRSPSLPQPLALITTGLFFLSPATAAETFTPYSEDTVPQTVEELWEGVDARRDSLDTRIVREWKEDGVVTRYVIFRVGTFLGKDSRIAAFYTFPEGASDAPAFVWAHGGGQRAEKHRGAYFARHGYATVDINWGGREMVEGIEPNTDWGNIDPSQGPQFYPGALRERTKLDFSPDKHTIDPVVSPRNGNWFMLAYAGRRALTFLEQQAEVDPGKLGFTGYSMGGNITSYIAIDERLQAVVPMVGGSGYTTFDFPGMPGTARNYQDHSELFARTMDSQSYYPHVRCPVLLLSATNDFHSTFENIYKSLNRLPHDQWRVSQKLHFSHSLGPEQWILMNRWFDNYLKGESHDIPRTPTTTFEVDGDERSALFTTSPDQSSRKVSQVEIYYSHDPNPKSRFWILADSKESDGTWSANLTVRESLPLFVFANCSYPLDSPAESLEGVAESFTITSDEGVYYPETIEGSTLHDLAEPQEVFADFAADGYRGWAHGPRGGLSTYKFQDPRAALPPADARMRILVDVPRKHLSYRFRATKNKYITGVREPQVTYFATRNFGETGEKEIILEAADFKSGQKEGSDEMTDWSNISTFVIDIYDGAAKSSLRFTDGDNRGLVQRIEWITE